MKAVLPVQVHSSMGCKPSKPQNKVENQDDITPKIYLNGVSNPSESSISDVKSVTNSFKISSRRPSSKVSNKPPKPEVEVIGHIKESGGHEQYVDLCEWNQKNDTCVTASSDHKANLWNFQDLKNVNFVPIQMSESQVISALTWSENGKIFITGSEHGLVSAWSSSGKLLQSWPAHNSSGVKCVKINSNHDLVLSGSIEELCVYSLGLKKAKLLCWNQSEFTALEWLTKDTFLTAEVSGVLTMDKVSTIDFKTVSQELYSKVDLFHCLLHDIGFDGLSIFLQIEIYLHKRHT